MRAYFTHSWPSPRHAAALAGLAASLLAVPGLAAVTTTTARDEAVAACEQSARRTLGAKTAQPAEITFEASPTLQPGLSNNRQVVLNGEGRWHAATGVRRVKFTCNVDLRTLEATGLVIRELAPVVARTAPVRRPAEPDLSHLSMASCESSAVQALRQRWPRVSQITFDSNNRTFRQDTPDRAELRGRGRARPAKGSPTTFFGFECEIDPKDGWVLATRVTE